MDYANGCCAVILVQWMLVEELRCRCCHDDCGCRCRCLAQFASEWEADSKVDPTTAQHNSESDGRKIKSREQEAAIWRDAVAWSAEEAMRRLPEMGANT